MEIKTDPSRLKPLVVGNKVFRSSFDYKLLESDLQRARVELNETDDLRDVCLRKLKQKLSRDDVKYRMDDTYLLRFLRYKKFKWKEAYDSIRYFYSRRKEYPDTLSSLPSKFDLETLLKLNIIVYLPYRDEDGSVVQVQKLGRWDNSVYSIYDSVQLFQIAADILSMNPACQVHKLVVILDFKDIDMSHIAAGLNPRTLIFWLKTFQSLNPWRLKQVILLNCHKLALFAINSCRYLLKRKISDRIVVLGSDMSQLHEYVNPAILPKEYGGSLEEEDCSITQHVMDNLPYLRYEHSFYDIN